MDSVSRRDFVAGLAAAGAVGGLVLPASARATPTSGTLREYRALLRQIGALRGVEVPAVVAPAKLSATEPNILGPYHRAGAPFRAKITPPLEEGTVLLIQGRVWGLDTKKPIRSAVLDIWQANAKGRYDNDDQRNPPKKNVFVNRSRLITDETGYYEYETIFPGRYKIDETTWRPAHIHYAVSAPGYRQLVTQLYFKGDPHNATDPWIKPSLIIDPVTVKVGASAYKAGKFDIVLAAAPRRKK
jgi:protocatechuate 3,4-dioxygenase beta subunit